MGNGNGLAWLNSKECKVMACASREGSAWETWNVKKFRLLFSKQYNITKYCTVRLASENKSEEEQVVVYRSYTIIWIRQDYTSFLC